MLKYMLKSSSPQLCLRLKSVKHTQFVEDSTVGGFIVNMSIISDVLHNIRACKDQNFTKFIEEPEKFSFV